MTPLEVHDAWQALIEGGDEAPGVTADRLAVLADLAEEMGMTTAIYIRGDARRALVTAWARERWPYEDVRLSDVMRELRALRVGEEVDRFSIHRPQRLRAPGWTDVHVTPQLDIVIVRERDALPYAIAQYAAEDARLTAEMMRRTQALRAETPRTARGARPARPRGRSR